MADNDYLEQLISELRCKLDQAERRIIQLEKKQETLQENLDKVDAGAVEAFSQVQRLRKNVEHAENKLRRMEIDVQRLR